MSKRSISWILDFTNKLPNDKERLACLKQNDTPAMRLVLQSALDSRVEWLLPEGDPPYTPNTLDQNTEARLYTESRKLYLFVKGGNDNLNQVKRETLFIELLQSIDPEDAKLLLACKDKKLPYKNITKKLVQKAFPDFIE